MGAVGCESSREWRLGFKERFARMEKWKIPPQKVAKGVGGRHPAAGTWYNSISGVISASFPPPPPCQKLFAFLPHPTQCSVTEGLSM